MKQVGKQELIDNFCRVAQELGKRPTLDEYNEHGEYSSTPIYKRFESFEELKDEAGFETGQSNIPSEQLVADLERVAEHVGRSPPVEAYDEYGEHNSDTLKRRFGNWNDVLNEAGLEPTDHSKHWADNTPSQKENRSTLVEVECDHCGGPAEKRESQLERYENVYCNHTCKGAAMSEQTGEDARSWEGGKVEIVCENCGGTKKVKQSETDKARFCSQGCMLEWRSETFVGENHQRWKQNNVEVYYGANWPEQREKARERDGYECQVCGMNEHTHVDEFGSAHDVHHIIKFKTFDSYKEANKLENLITLCMQCHQHVENENTTVPKAIWYRNKKRKSVS